MIKGTFWLEEKEDGSIMLGCEDYDTGFYDGGDYEWIYSIDQANAEKMATILSKTHNGSLKEMVAEEFGIHLDKKSEMEWFQLNGIEYEFFSWVHFD